MPNPSGLSPEIQESLRCPICRAKLKAVEAGLDCTAPDCGGRFPVVSGVPVLLNEQSSLFSSADSAQERTPAAAVQSRGILKKIIYGLTPSISRNIKGKANYRRFSRELSEGSAAPKVLIIGGRILGEGMEFLVNNPALDLVESDISLGPRTSLICDIHDLPFADGTFDGIVVQAVLEHVLDPFRCVEEIHRALKDDGLVYAETPFMQQVHDGAYDFSRFTHLGHRRLFRRFKEVDSGAVCGPGMALAWSYQYFLMSFAPSRFWREVLRLFGCWTAFFYRFFDHYLIDKPGTLDAAAGYYFLGRKSDGVLSDRDLLKLYGGLQ